MCGIAGFIGKGDEHTVTRMCDTLALRGPDDSGIYAREGVGLGHRRLSIIDLSPAGHQPMKNEDGTVWVAFNGEIYNFLPLRSELERAGHTFASRSDTEVLVHAYEEYGPEFIQKIDGMFAIALWDSTRRTLFLARDRMGKKPLYYGWDGSNFIFGSEIKALRAYPYFDFERDVRSLKKYFYYDCIPSPHTPWKNVYVLPSAHYALVRDGAPMIHEYWRSPWVSENSGAYSLVGLSHACSQLDDLLADAVKERLVSDVPLGVFLSGGLDSSTVAWYAQRLCGRKMDTFSIDFSEATFGEGNYAREVAKALGTEHHEELLSMRKAQEIIPEVMAYMDSPLADASLLPTYLLSKFTRGGVTVALSGDGADELLCGYQTFQAEKIYPYYAVLPQGIKNMLIKAGALLPKSTSYLSLDFKVSKFLHADSNPYIRHQSWLGSFTPQELKSLFLHDESVLVDDVHAFSSVPSAQHEFKKLIAHYQKFYLQDRVLVKVDRASMAASLEVRSPFLATRVVEWANALDDSYKLHGLRGKYVLRRLMEHRLPRSITHRAKKGFGVPLAEWFKGDLGNQYRSIVTQHAVSDTGLLRYEYCMNLLRDHEQGRAQNGQKLWSILVFMMWYSNPYGIK